MPIDRNEMRPLKYTVYVNDFQFPLAICIKIWLNNPHFSVFIGPIWDCCEPLNKHTWIFNTIVDEWEEQENPGYMKSFHSGYIWIFFQENRVIPWGSFAQTWTTLNALWVHSTETR